MRLVRNVSFLLFVSAFFLVRPAVAIEGCETGCGSLGIFPDFAQQNCEDEADENCNANCVQACGSSEMNGNWDGCDSAEFVGTITNPLWKSTCRCFCQADLE